MVQIRCGGMAIVRWLLLSLAFTQLLVAEDTITRPDPSGPLATDFGIIQAAAERALEIYTNDGSGEGVELLEAYSKDGVPQSAVLFEETDEFCYATFRGPANVGYGWVTDLAKELDLSYLSVRNIKKKRCRVVSYYKKLYVNKGRGIDGYKKRLDNLLSRCSGKPVVFAGHDLGGALATLAALEYAEMDHWSVTFGQPPVFMPPQYSNPGRLFGAARKKNPCKFINANRYVPFVNSEIIGGNAITGTMYYDFMVFLNVLIYGIMNGEATAASGCLADAASLTRDFFDDESRRGNLGSQFGQRYLLPGSNAIFPNTVSYLVFPKRKRFVDFGDQGNKDVVYSMVADPQLFDSSCETMPDLHNMETYLLKIQSIAPQEVGELEWESGFDQSERCNVDTDCWGFSCLETGVCGVPKDRSRGRSGCGMCGVKNK